MSRCRSLILGLLAAALCVHVSSEQYTHNMFLNGEYKNSISAHPETYQSVNPAHNIFLNHAIISRQAAPFTGPIYLPPKEYLKCAPGQQCVRQGQCQGGYFTQQTPKIQNCEPESDICCTYLAPTTTTTTTTTPKPYKTCNRDQDCVSSLDCRNGEIVAIGYIKKSTSNICYQPEVCCRMPSTTLTDNGYILHKPDKSFPLPTNPTVPARRPTQPAYVPPTTQPAYRPQPTQPTPAPYRPQPTQPPVYRPQPTSPPSEYLPPQTTESRQTPRPTYGPPPTQTPYRPQPTQPPYRPQPTQPPYRPQPTQPPYKPQPTQPAYRPEPAKPTNEYLPPQTTQKPYRPQPTQPEYRPQPTQPTYRPQPTQPAYRPQPTQPEYRPQPTQPEYRPQPTKPTYRPQPTQPTYRPQPTQPTYRPQPTQPTYRPQPTQPAYRPQPTSTPYQYLPPSTQKSRPQPSQPTYRPQPTQPAYRPQPTQPAYRPKPVTQYLPPVSTNEIDRQPQPSNIKPLRGEDQLSPQIFPPSKNVGGQPITYARCASALLCTPENYCNSIGVISETPIELSPGKASFRVPLTNCLIEGTGAPGKCCRDSNYVDPWPVNLAGVCAGRNKNTKPAGIRDIDSNFAEIPWQAMILKDSTKALLCGGAIIGDEFVVTAASCVSDINPSDVRIKAGEWELGRDSEPLPIQLVSAKTIDIHPEYNPSTGANDMAIIRLQKRLEFATHIQPICITDEDPKPSEQCVTTGWGKQALQIHEEGAIMHVTSTTPVSRSECGADSTSVCSSTKFDSCEFDIGSALACGTGSSVRLKGVYTVENACGENQVVRFSKPDIKWINTAFADRNKPLLLKRF